MLLLSTCVNVYEPRNTLVYGHCLQEGGHEKGTTRDGGEVNGVISLTGAA
jgi:hypothetical protein